MQPREINASEIPKIKPRLSDVIAPNIARIHSADPRPDALIAATSEATDAMYDRAESRIVT